ncbi:Hypothetical_protein [Hexamita inflata]|uniref:Hypothetical_protein n=1 Tax=Hexamita inflata TaxID=28002 RepID=A0AA86UM62_9EUKA|nr:Hypothetical protein HINF_LOCUS44416 [Hexamita inflata]CAI9957927.1 Hypothetical protein HINF_LOCUS45572 [Hexamita inflata]
MKVSTPKQHTVFLENENIMLLKLRTAVSREFALQSIGKAYQRLEDHYDKVPRVYISEQEQHILVVYFIHSLRALYSLKWHLQTTGNRYVKQYILQVQFKQQYIINQVSQLFSKYILQFFCPNTVIYFKSKRTIRLGVSTLELKRHC